MMSITFSCEMCRCADVMWTPYGTQSPTMRFRFELLAHDTSLPPAAGTAASRLAALSRLQGLSAPDTAADTAPAPQPASAG